MTKTCSIIVCDAGPIISLALADKLDLLLKPGLPLKILDAVYFELTRYETPTKPAIEAFVSRNNIEPVKTDSFAEFEKKRKRGEAPKECHLGERCIQDFLFDFSDAGDHDSYALLLFEDDKVAKRTFVLPDNVYLQTTRSFLRYLVKAKRIASIDDVLETTSAFSRSQKEVDEPPRRNKAVRPF